MEENTLIKELIIGRVEPHIYAFSTGTIPDYLKVGDTYRPVMRRLEEWKSYYPDLKKKYVKEAKVNDTTYFRDYAVHKFLEKELRCDRLLREDLPGSYYYSREFFRGATIENIAQAISDIKNAYENKIPKYTYFSFEDGRIPVNYAYERNEDYEPRPNQLKTIKRFKIALSKGRNNLLMYAVMRFGKSFTSMCCALEMKARLVVVVSAKADVKSEWKRTVESHIKFKDYAFWDSNALLQDYNVLEIILQMKKVVLFLTLQDLMGQEIKAVTGDETDMDIEKGQRHSISTDPHPTKNKLREEKEDNLIGKKLATYYAQILFYAFLTETPVDSLQSIISSIEDDEENKRIAKHLGLRVSILKLVQLKSYVFSLRALDYKIENLNSLMRDDSLSPMKRVEVAMAKFGRLSSSEVVTPLAVALEMINSLGEEGVTSTTKILDIASKQGEFNRALISKYGEETGKNIYALPTSTVSYEFTRKVYTLLGLDIKHIISEFTTYDLLDSEHKESYLQQLKEIKFDLVIGNPPYQQNIASDEGNKSLSKQLYPKFIEKSLGITKKDVVLITPSRWVTADGQDNSFPSLRRFIAENNHVRKILSYNGKSLFPNAELGDVAILVWEKGFEGDVLFEEHFSGLEVSSMYRPLLENEIEMIIPLNNIVPILMKVIGKEHFKSINAITTGRDVFGIPGKGIESRTSEHSFEGAYKVLCAKEKVRYIRSSELKKESTLTNLYKVFISKANGGAGLLTDSKSNFIIGKPFVAEPKVVCTDSLIAFGEYSNILEAQNLSKYLRTKFLRFIVGILKVSQNLYQNVYRFVPLQDFTEQSDIDWKKSIDEID